MINFKRVLGLIFIALIFLCPITDARTYSIEGPYGVEEVTIPEVHQNVMDNWNRYAENFGFAEMLPFAAKGTLGYKLKDNKAFYLIGVDDWNNRISITVSTYNNTSIDELEKYAALLKLCAPNGAKIEVYVR